MLEADDVPELYQHVAINMDHHILVFSGMKRNCHTYVPLNIIWMYNLYTEQWKTHVIPQGQTIPGKRYSACAVVIGSDVYMFGGTLYSAVSSTNKLWKLATDPQGSFIWSEIVVTNKEKTPSPRCGHTGWEHAEKLWIFGGFGTSSGAFLNEYGDYFHYHNNQLLRFNPSNEEWTNPQCHGMVPKPRASHATTKCQDKVWLYGGDDTRKAFRDLHELNMHSCTWTLIQTQQVKPQAHWSCTLSMISDDRLVLHGGYSSRSTGKRLGDTWILDLPTKTWRQYNSDPDACRSCHTGSPGINNSVVIIGGYTNNQSMYQTTLLVLIEPKSLQQLAMQKIYKHHTVLPWKCLPRKLTVLLDIQETQDADEASYFKTE